MPFHIDPVVTPDAYAALVKAIADGSATVTPYVAPVEVTPTLAQRAQVAMGAGLSITSTSTPALNGTYDVGAASQNHISA